MKPELMHTLKALALMGAIDQEVNISSGELGNALGISQQSASKRILNLLEDGLVQRRMGAKKQHVRITKEGLGALRREYSDYQSIFEDTERVTITGEVVTGMGEGQYYLTQDKYRRQFKDKLGFSPYKGTLNIKLSDSEMSKVEFMRGMGVVIEGFRANGRQFGSVDSFPCTLGGVACALILPKRTHYRDTIEIISRYHLRRSLGLRDGDKVEVIVNR